MKEPPPGSPNLAEGDPQNILSQDAQRRIQAAYVYAGIIRDRAIAEVHTRYRSEPESCQ